MMKIPNLVTLALIMFRAVDANRHTHCISTDGERGLQCHNHLMTEAVKSVFETRSGADDVYKTEAAADRKRKAATPGNGIKSLMTAEACVARIKDWPKVVQDYLCDEDICLATEEDAEECNRITECMKGVSDVVESAQQWQDVDGAKLWAFGIANNFGLESDCISRTEEMFTTGLADCQGDRQEGWPSEVCQRFCEVPQVVKLLMISNKTVLDKAIPQTCEAVKCWLNAVRALASIQENSFAQQEARELCQSNQNDAEKVRSITRCLQTAHHAEQLSEFGPFCKSDKGMDCFRQVEERLPDSFDFVKKSAAKGDGSRRQEEAMVLCQSVDYDRSQAQLAARCISEIFKPTFPYESDVRNVDTQEADAAIVDATNFCKSLQLNKNGEVDAYTTVLSCMSRFKRDLMGRFPLDEHRFCRTSSNTAINCLLKVSDRFEHEIISIWGHLNANIFKQSKQICLSNQHDQKKALKVTDCVVRFFLGYPDVVLELCRAGRTEEARLMVQKLLPDDSETRIAPFGIGYLALGASTAMLALT